MLPEGTQLGILTIIEIYHFYNMPVLFACRNKAGNLYLATWTDERETEDLWLYTPLSVERFAQMRNGQIDLHDAFAYPEDGIAFEVHVTKYADEQGLADNDYAIPVKAADLDATLAPPSGNYVNLALLPPIKWETVDQTKGASPQLALWLQNKVSSQTIHTYIQKIQRLEARVAELVAAS